MNVLNTILVLIGKKNLPQKNRTGSPPSKKKDNKGRIEFYSDFKFILPFSYSGTVTTYNYNNGNGYQLANQNQKICIR